MSNLKPHELRVVHEKEDLEDKFSRLDEFIKKNPLYENMDVRMKVLLCKQYSLMKELIDVLQEQIKLFNECD